MKSLALAIIILTLTSSFSIKLGKNDPVNGNPPVTTTSTGIKDKLFSCAKNCFDSFKNAVCCKSKTRTQIPEVVRNAINSADAKELLTRKDSNEIRTDPSLEKKSISNEIQTNVGSLQKASSKDLISLDKKPSFERKESISGQISLKEEKLKTLIAPLHPEKDTDITSEKLMYQTMRKARSKDKDYDYYRHLFASQFYENNNRSKQFAKHVIILADDEEVAMNDKLMYFSNVLDKNKFVFAFSSLELLTVVMFCQINGIKISLIFTDHEMKSELPIEIEIFKAVYEASPKQIDEIENVYNKLNDSTFLKELVGAQCLSYILKAHPQLKKYLFLHSGTKIEELTKFFTEVDQILPKIPPSPKEQRIKFDNLLKSLFSSYPILTPPNRRMQKRFLSKKVKVVSKKSKKSKTKNL